MSEEYKRSFEKYLEKYSDEINIIGPLATSSINTDPIIYIDGGAKFKTSSVGVSIGDGDSFKGELDIKLPIEKNYSDLSYVFKKIPSQYKKINLHGFLGKRKDHEIINLAEAHSFLLKRTNATMVSFEDKIIAYSQGDWKFTINGLFTLFSFEQNRVNLTGKCKYQLDDDLKPLSSHGLSNIGNGSISLEIESPIFIFL